MELAPVRRRLSRLAADRRAWMLVAVTVPLLYVGLAVVASQWGWSLSSRVVAHAVTGGAVLLVAAWRGRDSHSLGREGLEPLHRLHTSIQGELRRLPSQRRTGATPESLRTVLLELERATSELQASHEHRAAERLWAMDSLTEHWAPASDERAQALALVAHGHRVAEVHACNRPTRAQRRAARRRWSASARADLRRQQVQ